MLQKALFIIILRLSKLPLSTLYWFSDVLFHLNHFYIKYRYKDVYINLKNSFPDKNEKELIEIRRRYYMNFFDYLVETLKTFTITEKELRVRVQHLNRDVFSECKQENKDIILLAGHVFNWEWINVLSLLVPQENCHPVYRKVQNVFWEEKLKLVRNRFGNHSLEASQVIKSILRSSDEGNSIYMFVADQSPHSTEVNYGIRFLNQNTPVFVGYDKLSTKKNLAFIYCEMKKVKRGYYQVNYRRILPDNTHFKSFEVVAKFHHLLEESIRKRPDNWLWSHRRWKYQSYIKS